MRVLVTGGSGKLGMYVLRELLDAGHEVINLDRNRPGHHRGEKMWTRTYIADLQNAGDVLDVLMQVRPEGVVHLAANPAPHVVARHRQFLDNAGGCQLVFQGAADVGVKRIVYASSEQANGWSSAEECPPAIPFNETHMRTPIGTYALTKLLGEQILESVTASTPGLSSASLRINAVWREDDIEWWLKHMHRWPGLHANLWAYCEAADTARAFRLALEADIPGHHAYMVASADSAVQLPTREAVAKFFGPGIAVADDLAEFGSTVDCSLVYKELGWKSSYSWRNHAEGASVD